MATTKMIAHLVNQQVVHELLALELLTLFLTNPTEDSVEIAADFMIECGQVLSEATPAGVNAIFESFRTILHDGQIDKKVQYTLENLFAVRKTRFSAHPGVIQELDLVEESEKITHTVSLEDGELDGEDQCNLFQFDPNYEQTEVEWDEIKKEILGEEAQRINGMVAAGEGEESAGEVDNNQKVRYQ
jgi:pre-mRNA-splicing factor CWC22